MLASIRQKIRSAYADNPHLALCYWFHEFDNYVDSGNFAVCEGLLREIREEGYPPLTAKEQAYVDSREGVLWLKKGIEHHKQSDFKEAQDDYQQSLKIQQRVQCRNAQTNVELFQSVLEEDCQNGEPSYLKLDSFAQELHVLGGGESLLCDRLSASNTPEERSQILLAAVQARLTKPLVQAFRSPDEQTRMMGMAGLGRFKQINETQVLLEGLYDSNWFVRWRAAEALAHQIVTCSACNSENPIGIKFCQACRADIKLLGVTTDLFIQKLCAVLDRETSPDVRQVLVMLLGQTNNTGVTLTLLAALNDSDADVRIAVIEALVKIGVPSGAIKKLRNVSDGKSLLGGSIKETLEKIIGTIAEQSLRSETAIATYIVSQHGNGDYGTISEAIASVPPGSRILVQPGFYNEGLIINKPLEIIGEGAIADIIIESHSSSCILMQTKYALVHGFTLHGKAEKCYVVDIPQGQLVLEDCDITSDYLSCVAIHGHTANPVIRRCQIHDSKNSGIYCWENSQGIIEDCDIKNNATCEVTIQQGANPTIRHCRIHDGKQCGILIRDRGRGTVENCEIFGNSFAGIEINTGSDPKIHKCRIYASKANGVSVYQKGRGTIFDCQIFKNANAGVAIAEAADPTIYQCLINQNQYQAVWVYDNGAGRVENCDLTGNGHGAWNIGANCEVYRSGNQE
ncbi:MAG: right-handed parallel beta-helix repeat-containing protein [Nostoc sp.]|uniref:right-handed parallel beta-helix repeat-containing protein n=1 Tax=Nostoc sp. TaxID=1180 RepID=UPI002FFAA3F1